jgi:hypothetical protein
MILDYQKALSFPSLSSQYLATLNANKSYTQSISMSQNATQCNVTHSLP